MLTMMKMNRNFPLALLLTASGGLSAAPVSASVLFSDSLQGTLSNWTDTYHDVSIVAAPGGGKAATWSSVEGGGDLFTNSSFSSSTGSFTVSFQVYGNCGHTSECGLFLATAPPYTDDWVLSDTPYSDPTYGQIANFPEINQGWEEVSYTFGGSSIYLDFEDWAGSSYSGANSFYLRDIVLTNNPNGITVGTLTTSPVAVPEPSTWAMMIAGLAGLGLAVFRSRKSGTLAG